MTRSIRLACFLVLMMALSPPPAHANIWDWLEELSGPGPSDSRGNVMHTVCFTPTLLQPFAEESKKPCLFLDFRRFIADKDDNFSKNTGSEPISTNAYDFGLKWEYKHVVDVGAGVGIIHFSGNNTGATRMTLVAPRVSVKPGLLVAQLFRRNDFWAQREHTAGRRALSVIKFYMRYNVILGTLEAADFGVPAGKSSFKATNDVVRSRGFLIDLSELIRP